MLTVNGDEVQVELSVSQSLGVLKDDSQGRSFLISLEGDSVIVVCKFHDLSEVLDAYTKDHVSVSSEGLKAVDTQIEGNEGNM